MMRMVAYSQLYNVFLLYDAHTVLAEYMLLRALNRIGKSNTEVCASQNNENSIT
jgi:hypothetical protein